MILEFVDEVAVVEFAQCPQEFLCVPAQAPVVGLDAVGAAVAVVGQAETGDVALQFVATLMQVGSELAVGAFKHGQLDFAEVGIGVFKQVGQDRQGA